MNELAKNIVNAFGKQGKQWLANLAAIVEVLTDQWALRHITPVNNVTFNYVAKATTHTGQPVILKISCDEKSIEDEKQALLYFNTNGAIQLIDSNEPHHALLLQQAIPGVALTSFYPSQIEYVMDAYISTMQKLHATHLPDHHRYCHIAEWLKSLDNATSNQLPAHLVKRAIHLKNNLLSSMGPLVFLHGDLHHDNILKHHNKWLAIDPKGIIGEAEFEIAAFDFMSVAELARNANAKILLEERIGLLAEKANLNAQRIKDWVFVRLILMAAWAIEDKGDPTRAILLAERVI